MPARWSKVPLRTAAAARPQPTRLTGLRLAARSTMLEQHDAGTRRGLVLADHAKVEAPVQADRSVVAETGRHGEPVGVALAYEQLAKQPRSQATTEVGGIDRQPVECRPSHHRGGSRAHRRARDRNSRRGRSAAANATRRVTRAVAGWCRNRRSRLRRDTPPAGFRALASRRRHRSRGRCARCRLAGHRVRALSHRRPRAATCSSRWR